jgi:hypothetical protein
MKKPKGIDYDNLIDESGNEIEWNDLCSICIKECKQLKQVKVLRCKLYQRSKDE